LINYSDILNKLIRYNLKIIFAGRFVYFLVAALAFFILVTVISLFSDNIPSEATVYYLLIFPGLLLVFYPATFGIQNDKESRILEILFGIPNYRYKVWLVRLIMIYFIVAFILLILSLLSKFTIADISVVEMGYQLSFPIYFLGMLSFMFSTVIKNGNATAVIMIFVGMIFWISVEFVQNSQWNIFLNPFDLPEEMSETVWNNVITKNRLYLFAGTLLATLFGLFNLQKREKFV